MSTPELLSRLNGTRARGAGRWAALCPAHDDRNPSLSVTEGHKGLLVKCWAGCSLDEITAALGLRTSDLFYSALDIDPQQRRAAGRERDRRRDATERQAAQQGALLDALRGADDFVQSRRRLDIGGWSDEKLNAELESLAEAYFLLENEDCHGFSR